MTDKTMHWQTKLAAWTHDPAEKALVLMRDPAGHEGGTVRALRQTLFSDGLPKAIAKHIPRADHWASAADRPQFPQDTSDRRFAAWTQVRFDQQPVLIHPLSGEKYTLPKMDLDVKQIKAVSTDHFKKLIHRDASGAVDPERTALAFWRFGPELPESDIGALWGLLPADTRIPDHTIWAHLDLTSAFATCFALDGENTPALLTVSFGPVQEFIAQSRTTSDLWAGSHLLSRICWEGLKVICERVGPDAVLFPQLRGVALVDLWLRDHKQLDETLFKNEAWVKERTDANPLFAAALPNRFMALVPADQAKSLAEEIKQRVRGWVLEQANGMMQELLSLANERTDFADLPCKTQIETQLAGFPEVHWAAVPWSLVDETGDEPNPQALANALRDFVPAEQEQPGFLDSNAWKLLSKEIAVAGTRFYKPNAGVLYPGIYELTDRLAAAAKAVRPFEQMYQTDYRCSLTGESEWLTTNRSKLTVPPGQRNDTLWAKVANKKRAWAKKGEHLGALAMLKRLWPNWFVDQELAKLDVDIRRFVVSTHTMALASSLENWLANKVDAVFSASEHTAQLRGMDPVALPRRLVSRLNQDYPPNSDVHLIARRLPAYLDVGRDAADEGESASRVLFDGESIAKKVLGEKPEAYYALILMDGDQMGAWLSGTKDEYLLPYQDTWHPQIRSHLDNNPVPELTPYLNELRSVSPARHMAISSALNAFALHLARYVVEDLNKGKLLYAGGDDAMAMVSVDDLLRTMMTLRLAYSGSFPEDDGAEKSTRQLLGLEDEFLAKRGRQLQLGRGHALVGKRLYRLMGDQATASIGAVVAHHTTPLSRVMRELRAMEKQAKKQGGRDAFAIKIMKRAGGDLNLTLPWRLAGGGDQHHWPALSATPMGKLLALRDALADPTVSRRIAYIAQQWLPSLPGVNDFDDPASYAQMLGDTLAYQFQRQGGKDKAALGRDLANMVMELRTMDAFSQQSPTAILESFLGVAEFLAREGRTNEN